MRGPEVFRLSQESLASPTLGDTWLIPKRQNVLVRDICMSALLGCSRRELPQLSLSAGWQNVIRGSSEQSQTVPPSPPAWFLAHPGAQGQVEGGVEVCSLVLVLRTGA